MRYGLKNIITELHRGPGISQAADPRLYEACARNLDAVRGHLTIEGMRLLHNPHLGLFGIMPKEREIIEEECLDEGVEPFVPVWGANALDYHSSVLAVILRRRRAGTGGPEDGWAEVADLLREFETYLPEEDRQQEVATQKRFYRCAETLRGLALLDDGHSAGEPTFRASDWLLLRLTVDSVERFADAVRLAAGAPDADEDEADDEGDEG